MKHRLPLVALIALALAVPSFALAAVAAKSAADVAVAPASIALTIKSDMQHGKRDAKGVWHDAFLPASFSVRAGAKVTVKVTNYDAAIHTFTASGLKVNAVIAAAKGTKPVVTTFSFTAPTKQGAYTWFCAVPCDPWAMTHLGYMKGRVTVA